MKYGVIAIIVLAIFGGAIFFTQRSGYNPPARQSLTPPTPSLKTYTNDKYHFSFEYPKELTLFDGQDGHMPWAIQEYFPRFGHAVISVELPNDSYPQTNFGSAFATFSGDSVIGNERDCARYTDFQHSENTANPLGYRSLPMTETRTVGGVKYYYADMGGAAAGTRSDTRIYHVLRNGMYYEVSLNLFTANIDNYEPGTVTAVDEAAVWQRLEAVMATIKY
jgi:hypothetical protein